jgi:hypothetical protein
MNYRPFLAFAILIFCFGCKDNDQNALLYKTQGFIKGKIQGATSDSSYIFNDDFEYRQYLYNETESAYTESAVNNYVMVSLERDIVNDGVYAYFTFNFTEGSSDLENVTFNFLYRKKSGIKVYEFASYYNYQKTQDTFTVTDFSFDKTTGRIKGKFLNKSFYNSPDQAATIEGEFDVILLKKIR